MNEINNKNQDIPNSFYKYTTVDTGIKILTNSTVRFSSPLIFNDPFDSQLNIYAGDDYLNDCKQLFLRELKQSDIFKDDSSENMEKALSYKIDQFKKALNDLPKRWEFYAKHSRIFSVSETFENLLMWSHYTDGHLGIVIGFKKNKNGVLENVRKVNYSPNMPKYAPGIEDLMDDNIDFDEFFFENVYIKSESWAYEKEWRSIDVSESSDDYTDKAFLQEELDCIYLGCNMVNQKKSEIIDIVKNRFSKTKIIQSIKNKKDFTLDCKEIII